MNWALRRQLLYLSVLVVLFAGIGFILGYPYLNREPTCQDGKRNGEETGVDCGGLCTRACVFEVEPISVLWSRAFRVVPGRYNAVAYIENKNEDEAISRIHYGFRFADKNNIYIGKREGETFIPPGGKFAIFEPAIDVGNSIPVYVTFEFTEVPIWTRVPENVIKELQVSTSNIRFENETQTTGQPTGQITRLSATIKNDSLFIIPEVNVVAILYDELGNALGASRTYLEELGREEAKEINFTWPEPITKTVVRKEIIPMYNVLLAQIK